MHTARYIGIVVGWVAAWTTLTAQPLYPVKMDKKWGLINTEGQLVQSPTYEAIGEFKHFGQAVVQKNGGVGLLGANGQVTLPPNYDDIKVLDTNLVAVMQQGAWRVINRRGETILSAGYQRVRVLRSGYLAYMQAGKWGMVNEQGQQLAAPEYDQLDIHESQYFICRKNDLLGLINQAGRVLLAPIAHEIKPLENGLFFYRKSRYWGAIDTLGQEKIPAAYDSYRVLDENFVKLFDESSVSLYTLSCGNLSQQSGFDDFYAFSPYYLITKKKRMLGLLDACGRACIPPLYQEIQSYGDSLFRVNFEGKWGVVNRQHQVVIPLAYQYISPLQDKLCVVQQGGAFGVLNDRGEVAISMAYSRIELANRQVRAYKPGPDGKEELTLFSIDAKGTVTKQNEFTQHFQIRVVGKQEGQSTAPNDKISVYQLDKFEWFYSAAQDRWGLRNIFSGQVQIEPIFDYIQVHRQAGYTLVGLWKANDYDFERTTFRFDMILGVVLNDMGLLVTEVDFLDVQLSDFEAGLPAARVIFSNGRYGLMDRTGKIIRKDITYIGSFSDGLAKVSFSGRLSGSRTPAFSLGSLSDYLGSILVPNTMLDYTQYDQLFQQTAALTCDNCEWGYIDTLGRVAIKPAYTAAQDFVNEAAIVNCNGKWGMLNREGRELIPCQYDAISFLENTGNRMVKVHLQQPKYGLIDTLGQLTVSAVYEEIGSFSDGRLAVKRNGLWGFVNRDGLEVIPCRFREVQDFSEGMAAVKVGNLWGFIDLDGDTAIPIAYAAAGNFRESKAWVKDDTGVYYINRQREVVIGPLFQRAFDFYRGVARVVVGQQYGLIDSTGVFLVKPRFTGIEAFDTNGVAVAQLSANPISYGLLHLSGQLLTTTEFKSISPFREGLAAVRTKAGYGYINTTGKIVIAPQYAKAGDFYENRAVVQLNNKCGYIDQTGAVIVPCAYSGCQDFSGGRAVVYQGIKNAGIVNRDGQLIVEPSLDRLIEFQEGRGLMRDDQYRFYYITEETSLYDGYYERATAFRHGVAVVRIGGKWGIINQKGIEIIPPKYDHIDHFEGGYAKVKIEGYNGLSNLDGQLIVQPHYEFISYAGNGLFRVEQGDKIGYFNNAGEWVWDLSK